MNYAHDFHAGNFADVFKHIFLARVLLYLARKPAPFRFIETHAGAGLYDLAGPEAARGGEWRAGVGRLMSAPLDPAAQALIEPYWAIVAPFAAAAAPRYPGSPLIASALLRPQDRLIACELHQAAFARLKDNLWADRRAKALLLDGYAGLKAFIPPIERRGLVLIDPPFEDVEEFSRLARTLPAAVRKWPGGVFMLWHPVKDRAIADAFAAKLGRDCAASGAASALRLELAVAAAAPRTPLARCGLIVVNAPFTLEAEARSILPPLVERLGGADYLIDRLPP